ncbi:MAG: hypothetical protein EAX96_05865 [Candidatus Lokiarchaeota archaeon]|nr:hypothetical protein [Candidatus Lokiarchaeota archaeon]
MKKNNGITLNRIKFLVRDKHPRVSRVELFMPSKNHYIKMIKEAKTQGITIIGNLWKGPAFYFEVETIFPVLKGTLLTENEKTVTEGMKFLELLLVSIS